MKTMPAAIGSESRRCIFWKRLCCMIKGIRLSSYVRRIEESIAYVHRNTRILWVRWRRTLDSIPIMVWWVEQQRSEVRAERGRAFCFDQHPENITSCLHRNRTGRNELPEHIYMYVMSCVIVMWDAERYLPFNSSQRALRSISLIPNHDCNKINRC